MTKKPGKPLSDKELREQQLAVALRANLRRRKAAPKESTPGEGDAGIRRPDDAAIKHK
ncbi:hypothetical protein [Caulobacter mirabilis]|uniref:hypothetical protein n=1 Tax=Caulobacter mirabilis TaxID=69666 RepID=UPI0015593B9D|nr:hypothetical protein [Caulobacter mirabilis]